MDAVLWMLDVAAHYGAGPGEIAKFLVNAVVKSQAAPAQTGFGGDPQG